MIRRTLAMAALLLVGIVVPTVPAGAHTANCHGHYGITDYFYAQTGWAGTTSALGFYSYVWTHTGSVAVAPNHPRLIATNWIFLNDPVSLIEPFVGVSADGDYGMHISSDEWVQYEYWATGDQWFNFGSVSEGVWHSFSTYRTAYAFGVSDWTTVIDGVQTS